MTGTALPTRQDRSPYTALSPVIPVATLSWLGAVGMQPWNLFDLSVSHDYACVHSHSL
jgi:hypothetical protein